MRKCDTLPKLPPQPMRTLTVAVCTAALLLLTLLGGGAAVAEVRFFAEAEAGAATVQYNNIRIPGDDGTRISTTDDLSFDPFATIRLRLGLLVDNTHRISLLAAPLQYSAWGELPRETRFEDTIFPEGEFVRLAYRFNSWRLTYRYEGSFPRTPDLRLGIGATAKIRDAAVSLQGDTGRDEKTDLGFVPLINLYLHWEITETAGLRFELDGLAAPQGRAFDGLIAATWRPTERVELYLGYRALEGGADNDEVFNFTYIHFAVLGIGLHL